MTPETASEAWLDGVEQRHDGLETLGPAQQPDRHLGDDPHGSFGTHHQAHQVVARRVQRFAAQPHDLAVPGVTRVSPSTWLVVTPYFRQCAPPAFSATLPPIVQTGWLEGSGA